MIRIIHLNVFKESLFVFEMFLLVCTLVLLPGLNYEASAQFAPAAGQPGSTAIHKDSVIFINWAAECKVQRGFMDISRPDLGFASAGSCSDALGKAGERATLSLGDGGKATLFFDPPITNGLGWDFAVFENGFDDTFLELAFVEVSSDGEYFVRFPSVSLTQTDEQVGPWGTLKTEKIHNLAGKYRLFYGTPFDLEELRDLPGLDINQITHVRIIDVVGSINEEYASFDSQGNKINDPWPTAFPAGGFDLDAIGVINSLMPDKKEVLIRPVPNPSNRSGKINIFFPEKMDFTIIVSDLKGQEVFRKEILPADKGYMNLPVGHLGLTNGLYIIHVTSNKYVKAEKFIFQE